MTTATSPYLNKRVRSHQEVALLVALKALIRSYTELVDSGDCIFLDSRTMPEVVSARAAIKESEET